jgi:anti-sigma factor RsiW
MKESALHFEAEQFNLLLDGRLPEAEVEFMRAHLEHCGKCRLVYANLKRVDLALRNMPVVETRAGFTRSVMDGILGKSGSSFAFRMFERLSYVFGLLIVLGIMVTSFILTGVFDASQVGQTTTVASEFAGHVGDNLLATVNGLTAWLVQYLPFAFGKGSISVAFFGVAVVLMLAAVDRVVGRRLGKTS